MTLGLIIASLVLVLYNLLYNNLLINLRFKCKLKYRNGCGFCCFDIINYLQCYCCLDRVCRDHCFQLITVFKWVVKGCIMFATMYMIQYEKIKYDADFVIGGEYDAVSNLDWLLVFYIVQHPMFMFVRIPCFSCYLLCRKVAG